MENEIQVHPRIKPRDFADFCIVAFIASPIIIGVLIVVPAIIAFIFTRSFTIALLVSLAIYVIFLLFSVSHLTFSPDGIRFHRILGSPKFLSWNRIVSISEAPRWELIFWGWLLPVFPAREMTASFSSVGHYRIQWDSGYCYFPPKFPDTFEKYVQQKLERRPR